MVLAFLDDVEEGKQLEEVFDEMSILKSIKINEGTSEEMGFYGYHRFLLISPKVIMHPKNKEFMSNFYQYIDIKKICPDYQFP